MIRRHCFAVVLFVTVVQVVDTIFNADGTKPSGAMTILWRPFTASNNDVVGGGSKTFTITDGAVNVSLVPNASSTPANSCYEVTMTLGGSVKTEVWSVPATGPTTLNAVRSFTLTTPCPSVK